MSDVLPCGIQVAGFIALERSVTDLRRSVAFYCEALGFEQAHVDWSGGRAVLRLGDERIDLVARGGPPSCAIDAPGPDVRFQHVAIVASDMSAAFARLAHKAYVFITRGGPQQLPAASGGVTAYKFRDPDGHPLELIAFPPGQGPQRWRTQGRHGPTLGIDHAAISVSDVARSIGFYAGLGFTVASRHLNRGDAQARLDWLVRSEVEVVALTSEHAPGIAPGVHLELLGYVVPAPVLHIHGDRPSAPEPDRLLWGGSAALPWTRDPDGHLIKMARSSFA